MSLFHVNIVCSDFDRSYRFYVEFLGLRAFTQARGGAYRKPVGAGPAPGGRLPGEARHTAGTEDGLAASRALDLPNDSDYRAALLYWPGQPSGPFIDLLEWRQPGGEHERTARDLGLARLAIRVEDIDGEITRLSALGVEFISKPVTLPVGRTFLKLVAFYDPDGTMLELVEYPPGGLDHRSGAVTVG